VKLLRVLETARVVRVGGTDGVDVDVRVIAATNSEPDEAVSEGRLREDLYYRLKVFPIRLPPLRDREGDLELLALHFLDRLNELHDTKKRIVGAVFERLAEHAWPGNVRELKNVIERAFILADDEITPELLPAELEGAGAPSGPYVRVKVGASLEEAEKRLILATLDQLEGNKKVAADVLGISLKTLYNRLNSYESARSGTA
jgi:transcriptional regulator with PAS, ATPase and Fis domain